MSVEIVVKLNLPIIGSHTIGKVSGNLKQGVVLKIGYKLIASGELGVRLVGDDVILYWNFSANGKEYAYEIKRFSILCECL